VFVPADSNIEGKTVQQLINTSSKKAFAVSFAAAVPPGFLGWATLIPELITITKIQINLIHAIAKYYGQEEKLNPVLLSIIFSTALGLELGKGILQKAGAELIISKMSSELFKPIIERISVKTLTRLLEKIPSRWIPLMTAPIFGTWSAMNTKAIGYAADKLFSKNIRFEEEINE
jgi:uncharacterized protein (DUF697 family)